MFCLRLSVFNMLLFVALRLWFAMIFCCSFFRMFPFRTITTTVARGAIGKAFTATATSAAASTPSARTLFLRFLTAAGFDRCGFNLLFFRNITIALVGQHYLLGFNRLLRAFCAWDFNYRRFRARACNRFANGIGVFILFQKEIGNIKKGITLQPYVDKC